MKYGANENHRSCKQNVCMCVYSDVLKTYYWEY